MLIISNINNILNMNNSFNKVSSQYFQIMKSITLFFKTVLTVFRRNINGIYNQEDTIN